MAMSFSEGLRYAAYGIVVAGAAIAYFRALIWTAARIRPYADPFMRTTCLKLRLIERDMRQGTERDTIRLRQKH